MKDLVECFYHELWNRFDSSRIPKLLTEDVRFRGSLGDEVVGHDGFATYVEKIQGAFPDFHNRIEEFVAEGERAFVRLTYTGTHRGTVLGVPPTGRRIEYAGAALLTCRDGRIWRAWVLGDLHSLLSQLRVGQNKTRT